MQAIIMAGGKGTRLRPLTCDKPKPMVPVANRPLLEHIILLLATQGWRDITITLCYQPEKIEAFFGDGSRLGVRLRYLIEDQPLGTAGSVKKASPYLKETFVVASGDALTDFNLLEALAFHRARRAKVTVVLTRVSSPLEYGVVLVGGDGGILRFLEKPGWGEVFSDTVNTGIYLIEPEVLSLIPQDKAFDFSRDLFPLMLAEGGGLYGFVAEGYWSDIGTLEQYRRANYDALARRVKISIPGVEFRPGVWIGQGMELDARAVIEAPALIGDYCRIGGGTVIGAYSSLGDHSVVAGDASIKRTILWRHAYIGERTEIRGAIVADHALIRDHNAIYEGTVVGSGCVIGSHGTIYPEVKLWPGKQVESGAVIRESMVWNERSLRGLFGNAGVSGVANLEMTPEFTVKLSASFASILGQGRKVVMAGDGSAAGKLLKRAASVGMMGAGLQVLDLGTVSLAVCRFAIGMLGLAGGLYISLLNQDPLQTVVQFLDERGLPLRRQDERSLEHAFYTEDFPRMDATRVGVLNYAPGLAESYLDALVNLVDTTEIEKAGFKVVLPPLTGPASNLLPALLDRLSCSYVRLEQREMDWPGMDPQQRRSVLAAKIAACGADFAVSMDRAMEQLTVYESGGDEVSQPCLMTLMSLAELRRGEGVRLVIPVTATEAIEDLAKTLRGDVVRAKMQRRSLQEEYAAMPAALRGLILPAFDALAALARLLELLADDGRDLKDLSSSLPVYQRVETAVACTWGVKGRLIRRLIEENQNRTAELTDGLRLRDEQGWTLILPDGEEPFIRVYSEAGTSEEADALNKLYVERLLDLQKEEEQI